MRRIFLLAANDLRLTIRDRAAFIWMLMMPIAFMWIFGQAAGGGTSGPPKFTLTIDDQDGGWLARAVVAELEDEQVNLRTIGEVDADDELSRVRTLVIPVGFTDGVLVGGQQTVRLVKDAGADEEFSLAAEAHITRTIVRTIGRLVEINAAAQSNTAPLFVVEEFRNRRGREPLVGLDVSTAGMGRPVPRGFAQSVPGMLTMTVLMMTVIYGGVFLTTEKRSGMLTRQVALPVTRQQIVLGKLSGRFLLAALQIAMLVLAGRFLFGISFGSSPAALMLLLASYALAVAGLAVLLGAVLRTPEQASGIGWMTSMVLAAMGGCWWPSEVVPDWLWKAAHVLPTAWAMDAFHALISFGFGFEAIVGPSAVLVAFGILFTGLGARFLRTS
jgi:ABC-type multidrug transport system permease subunit